MASWKTRCDCGRREAGVIVSPCGHPSAGRGALSSRGLRSASPLLGGGSQPRLCTECKCYQKALVAGKNNASEVNEVMGTSVPDPSRLSRPLFVRVWASLFIFAGLQPSPWVPGCGSFTHSVARRQDTCPRTSPADPGPPKWSVSPESRSNNRVGYTPVL